MKFKIAMSHFYVPTQEFKDGVASDPHYIHIGSGRRLHETNDEWVRKNIVLDDSLPDNIAERNYTYCELTNIYFVWRNMDKLLDKDVDYIGLCHYRRRFDTTALENVLEKAAPAIICSAPAGIGNNTIDSQYRLAHDADDWEMLKGYLRESYYHMENKGVTEQWLNFQALVAPYNCFVMRKDIFEDWCRRIFPVLDDIYLKRKDDIDRRDNYQRRAIGFLGERFTSWYATHMSARGERVGWMPMTFDADAKPKDATDNRQGQTT